MGEFSPVSIWPVRAELGEGPAWVAREQALWFVDIKGRKIHRYHPTSGAQASWDAPEQCGFVLPAADGRFIVGLQTGLHFFTPSDGRFCALINPEPHAQNNRLNDGAVAPDGALWFGTMDDAESAVTGAIYRLGVDDSLSCMSPRCSITNGPAFSLDGRTMYHVDTLGGVIFACTIGDEGAVVERRVFAAIPSSEGYPDGPTIDAEGCVWIGLFGGWAARRYAPDGALLQIVHFPVANVTKVAFGGPHLRTLYATTATKGLSPAERAAQPHAGDLFAMEVDTPGNLGVEIIRRECAASTQG